MAKKKNQKVNTGSQAYSAMVYVLLAVLIVMSAVLIYKKGKTGEEVLTGDQISEQVGPEDGI